MPRQPRFPSKRTLAPQPAPRGLYASTYDPELGAAICRRLAGGESLRSICRADASMPTEKTVWNWARAYEEFRMMKAHALATARERSLAAQAERDAARWGREKPFGGPRGRTGRPSGYCEAVADAILERLVVGEGLEAVCRDPAMPSVATVYGWLRRYPEFLEGYRQIKGGVEEAMVELACADLPWLGERKSWPILHRTVRAAERAARRLSLKRLAPAAGPRTLTVRLKDADGTQRVLYEG
jgi:hypothetical protein